MTLVEAGPETPSVPSGAVLIGVLTERALPPGTERWSSLLEGNRALLDGVDFRGDAGQVVRLPAPVGVDAGSALLVGLGPNADNEALRRASGWAARSAAGTGAVATDLHTIGQAGAARAVTEGFLLGSYRFDRYRSRPKPPPPSRLVLSGAEGAQIGELEAGQAVAQAVAMARDLVLEPAAAKSPEDLAARFAEVGTAVGATVEILEESQITAAGLGGLAGVGAGSTRSPRLVRIRYRPEGATGSIALVGKGITFDSGGLSLKTADLMEPMKSDMAGAAAVVATLQAVVKLGLPLEVEVITPLADNLPSGSAMKPGDVLLTRNGKTIEVLNTDAEGRLVLADALALAAESIPDVMIDVATLTGAAKVALGEKVAGVWGNHPWLVDAIVAAATTAGESVWPMPLHHEYRALIDSDLADMKNTGGRFGGAITAALLLSEFVGDVPWAHIDIAGPARWPDDEHYQRKGASGFGVRTLVALCETLVLEGTAPK
ncbi:MAG TPA: leucyl aminopeptidase [Acidimicrobiia bacterium]|nr:leucyl aminopeptidase [Acidimicrobiia bacterium]